MMDLIIASAPNNLAQIHQVLLAFCQFLLRSYPLSAIFPTLHCPPPHLNSSLSLSLSFRPASLPTLPSLLFPSPPPSPPICSSLQPHHPPLPILLTPTFLPSNLSSFLLPTNLPLSSPSSFHSFLSSLQSPLPLPHTFPILPSIYLLLPPSLPLLPSSSFLHSAIALRERKKFLQRRH